MSEAIDEVPAAVREYAAQAVAYVQRALGVPLEYDSNTLPLLDHYLRNVPSEQAATLQLVIATAGAYFGEVVRHHLGGRWELDDRDLKWRFVLPTGLNFSPAGIVAAAIAQADLEDLDSEFDAPPRMQPYVEAALARMGELSTEAYYSLCGRLDTLEHLHEVLVTVASQLMGGAPRDGEGELDGEVEGDGEGGDPAEDPAEDPVDPRVAEDGSGTVN